MGGTETNEADMLNKISVGGADERDTMRCPTLEDVVVLYV